MIRPVVFVFTRAPCYGSVKTRLSREIGAHEALRFFRNSLEQTCRRLGNNRAYEIQLATTPLKYLSYEGMWPAGFTRVDQGVGDLGQRMISVLRSAGPRPAVLVGSDIPNANESHILEALRMLRCHPYVLGPVADGGYWLIGARSPQGLSTRQLKGVRWSTPFALSDTETLLPGAARLTETLFDVDDADSYRHAKSLHLI